jgi:hypothetical protein
LCNVYRSFSNSCIQCEIRAVIDAGNAKKNITSYGSKFEQRTKREREREIDETC